jgi:hypothetical protein
VIDGFTSNILRIWLAGAEFKAYKFPLKVEKKFLELDKIRTRSRFPLHPSIPALDGVSIEGKI